MNKSLFIKIFVILFVCKNVLCTDVEDAITLIELDYEDQCALSAESYKKLLTSDLTNIYNYFILNLERILYDKSLAQFKHRQVAELKLYEDNYNEELERKFKLLTKIGDGLLPEESVYKVIQLMNDVDKRLLSASIPCPNATTYCRLYYEDPPRILSDDNQMVDNVSQDKIKASDILQFLEHSRNKTELELVWTSWLNKFKEYENDYLQSLQLVQKAAELNDYYDVSSYWNFLNEYDGGVEQMRDLWTEIEPLYRKLHKFVKDRLVFQSLDTNDTSEIPIYLLGSLHGEDWSKIADTLLPHPQTYNKIVEELQNHNVGGKRLYLTAQRLVRNLGLNNFNYQFWANSVFDSRCPPHLINFCQQGNMIVVTCNKTSFSNFVEAHSFGLKLTYSEMMAEDDDKRNTYILRNPPRYSAFEEALREMGKLLAIHPSNLHAQKLLFDYEYNVYKNKYNADRTLLLLNALRILPQLAYYYTMDQWRLEILQSTTNEVDWWHLREQHQGVHNNGLNVSDILTDLHVIKNEPYLSKFFGTILQFQILKAFETEEENEKKEDLFYKIRLHTDFRTLLQEGFSEEWPKLLDRHLRIDRLDATPLLNYFKPLEEYLDAAPLEQNTEKPEIITTTTTTTPSTTTVTITTVKTHASIRKPVVGGPSKISTQNSSVNSLEIDEKVETKTENLEDNNIQLSSSNLYIIVGCVVLIIGAVIGIITVYRLRAKSKENKNKRNNRRFET